MKTIYISLLMLLPALSFGQNKLYDFNANPLPDSFTYFHIDENAYDFIWIYKKESQEQILSNNIFIPTVRQHYTNEYKHLIEEKGVKHFYLDMKMGHQYQVDKYFETGDETYLDLELIDIFYHEKLKILRPYVVSGQITVECYQNYFYHDFWQMVQTIATIGYDKHLKGLDKLEPLDIFSVDYVFSNMHDKNEKWMLEETDAIDTNDAEYYTKEAKILDQYSNREAEIRKYEPYYTPRVINFFNDLSSAYWGRKKKNVEEIYAIKNSLQDTGLTNELKLFFGDDYKYITAMLDSFPYVEDMKAYNKKKNAPAFYQLRVNQIYGLVLKDTVNKSYIEIQDNSFAGLCTCKHKITPFQQFMYLQLSTLAKNSFWMQSDYNSSEYSNGNVPEGYDNKIGYYQFTNTTAPVLFFLFKYD